MSPPFDSTHVRHAFGRAATSYDEHAILQHEVELRLLERLEYVGAPPAWVLDVGCGPGHAATAMHQRWKHAQVIALDVALPMLRLLKPGWLRPIHRITGDACSLPIADASVDVLFSNLCIQWIDDLPRLFDEFRRVLRPGGYFAFSTFGPDTLHELREAWAQVDRSPRVSVFADMARIGDALVRAGFRDPVLDSEHFVLNYQKATSLMRELKAIGATNANPQRSRGLLGRARLQRVAAAYETHRRDGALPATYEVIYAHAFAPPSGQPRRNADGGQVASFSVDQLRDSRR